MLKRVLSKSVCGPGAAQRSAALPASACTLVLPGQCCERDLHLNLLQGADVKQAGVATHCISSKLLPQVRPPTARDAALRHALHVHGIPVLAGLLRRAGGIYGDGVPACYACCACCSCTSPLSTWAAAPGTLAP